MENYRHILFVTNCVKEDEADLIQQVKNLIASDKILLSLVHVIPSIPSYYLQCPTSLELEKQLKNKSQLHLRNIAEKLSVDAKHQFIRVGNLEREVDELAAQLGVDLIVMAKAPEQNFLKLLAEKLLHLKSKAKHRRIYIHSLFI